MTEPVNIQPDGDPPYVEGLNAPQREAVLTIDGPVLVLAGAGTGKPAALTRRLAHIVYSQKAWPSEILAVTFTNQAAREMKERIAAIVGEAFEGMPWLGTFHSIGSKMVRRHAELVGLKSNFTILDTDDQIRLLKQLIQAEEVDDKRWPARMLAGLIDQWKNRGLNPQDLDTNEAERYDNGKGQHFYTLYQERLKALNACDFGDLLLHITQPAQDQSGDLGALSGAVSNIFWSTNIRTPIARNICGCDCWRRNARISAASAMTTSPSTAGAARRWRISCVSRRISPTQKSSSWNRITARPRISSPLHPG